MPNIPEAEWKFPSTREQFGSERGKYIGASELPSIAINEILLIDEVWGWWHDLFAETYPEYFGSLDMFISKCPSFSTATEVYAKKCGLPTPPIDEKTQARFDKGHQLELVVLALALHENPSWKAIGSQNEYSLGRVTCHIDYLMQDDQGKFILEATTVDNSFYDWENEPTLYKFWQIQIQMGLSGIRRGVVVPMLGYSGFQLKYHWVEFNPAMFEMLMEMAESFWTDYIIKRVVPPVATLSKQGLQDKLGKQLSRLYNKPKEIVDVEADDECSGYFQQAVAVKKATDDNELNKSMSRNRLSTYMLNKQVDVLRFEDGGKASFNKNGVLIIKPAKEVK